MRTRRYAFNGAAVAALVKGNLAAEKVSIYLKQKRMSGVRACVRWRDVCVCTYIWTHISSLIVNLTPESPKHPNTPQRHMTT